MLRTKDSSKRIRASGVMAWYADVYLAMCLCWAPSQVHKMMSSPLAVLGGVYRETWDVRGMKPWRDVVVVVSILSIGPSSGRQDDYWGFFLCQGCEGIK
jgi:hypothetical protein